MTVNTTKSGTDGTQDRRRAREDRGLSTAAAAANRGDRLPPPPRERRPMLAAFAVLLIVGGAAAAGLLAVRSDSRVPVLVAARDIAVGEPVTADALRTVPVAAEGTQVIPATQEELVVGKYPRVNIAAGQLLDATMLTGSGTLQPGKVAVGASLAAGRVPASGLVAGDVVQLVRVAGGEGTVLVDDALVSSVTTPAQNAAGGSGAMTATFIVEEDQGARIAGVAAEGELAVVLVTAGEG